MELATLFGQDNKSYSNILFFEKENNTIICKSCKSVNSPYYFDKSIDLKKTDLDFSVTYEGKIIVSKRFKNYCIESKFENTVFIPLDSVSGFYYFLILGKTLFIDIKKSGIKRSKTCKECGYYKEIIGSPDKLFVTSYNPKIKNGFYQTDIYWRTHNVFNPQILITLETMAELKNQKFKGLHFAKGSKILNIK